MAERSAGADAAYDRAFAAFQEGSYDVSRQWVLEALARDASHPRARDLLARLDAVRRPSRPASFPQSPAGSSARPGGSGPEVVSTDPTVLISRASRAPVNEPIAPTVMVRRDDPARRRPDDDPFAPPAPRYTGVSEPTVIAQRSAAQPPPPPGSGAAPSPRPAAGGAALGWRERWFGTRTAASRTAAGGSLRGVGVAVAAVAAAALLLFAGIAAVRWLWPSGQVLTVTRPTGGTITGPGVNCGTRGSDCTTTRPNGDPVELIPQPDDGYVFSGFFGDCAPTGRFAMTAARTCGAVFNRVAAPEKPVVFLLSIIKPVGGTIIGAPDILCGTDGATCSAQIPSGQPVTLRFSADNGYTFGTFTGDCSPQGETTMTAARTCGATFIQTQTTVANREPGPRPMPRPTPRQTRPATEPTPATGASTPAPPPPVTAPVPPPAPAPDTTQAPPPGPVEKPITAEDHAKNEIEQLVNAYCQSLETLDPKRVQKWFPLAQMGELRDEFRQYKSLRCTITSPPKYDRLDAIGAGGAQLKFGMKQEIQMRSGGAPVVLETIVTMVTSRANFQSPWLIDRVRHEPKPKN